MADNPRIPYGRQSIGEEEIAAVVDVLRSDWLTQGPKVPLFEQKLREFTGARDVVAVNSATSGLHLACLGLGLKEGDVVWTTPISFVASANCARYCGAEIDFVDIDPFTWNIDPAYLENKLLDAARTGRLPKIVVVVDFAGMPASYKKIRALSRKYGFAIIEDASHALGSMYDGEMVGKCGFSDATIFSFHPVKTITTGEGGAVCVNDPELSELVRALRSHGIVRDREKFVGPDRASWMYEQQHLGFNYRMNDLEAALGLIQMDRLPDFMKRRQKLVDAYKKGLSGLPIITQKYEESAQPIFHLFVVLLQEERLVKNRNLIIDRMSEQGVTCNLHYRPIHHQPYYQRQGSTYGDLHAAEDYYQRAITLPLFPQMSDQMLTTVVDSFSNVVDSI